MAKLSYLSASETRALLCKYFDKVRPPPPTSNFQQGVPADAMWDLRAKQRCVEP